MHRPQRLRRDSVQPGLIVHARNGCDQGVEVSSLGKQLEHLFAQGHPLGRALDIDKRRLAHHRYLLFDSTHFQRNIQSDGHIDANIDLFPGDRFKPLEFKFDCIGSRLQRNQAVSTVDICRY